MPVILVRVETVAIVLNGLWLNGSYSEIDEVAKFLTKLIGQPVSPSDPLAVQEAMKLGKVSLVEHLLTAEVILQLTYPSSLVMYGGTVNDWVRHMTSQLGTPDIKLECQ